MRHQTQFVRRKKFKAVFQAIRPKTISASLIPVVAASCLSQALTGIFRWEISLFALLTSLCIQIGMNFINDVIDYKNKVDGPDRKGDKRLIQLGFFTSKQVYNAGIIFLLLAWLFGIPLIFAGGPLIAVLIMISILCGYFYSGGPYPISYLGFSDPLVIIFYGFVSTCTVYFLQTQSLDIRVFLAAYQIGSLATVMLAINNLRDIHEDRARGKCTLAVRFGEYFSRWEISFLLIGPFILNLFWLKWYYGAAIMPFATFPLAIWLLRLIWITEPSYKYNQFLAMGGIIHVLFGLILGISFLL